MKALVVYHSLFGNTKRIAETIGEQLGIASVDVKPLQQLTAKDLEDLNLLVMGTPTHRMTVPPEASQVIAQLPKDSLAGVKVAAFDTSMKVNWFVDLLHASGQLLRKLRRLGGKAVADPAVFWVTGFKGP
ncbi:MAG: flavodoxin family protein [Anaerolineales bacterium]